MSIVTMCFKKTWRYRCHNNNTAIGRRKMKESAHRKYRRRAKDEIRNGRYDIHMAPIATGWDVA